MGSSHRQHRSGAARSLSITSAALIALLASTPARAQSAGTITGTIVDAITGKPIEGVVVTVTSPALQGPQRVRTDASGAYRIPDLPQGTYTLRIEGNAHLPYARAGIPLSGGSTLRANAELLSESAELSADEVLVVGQAPTIDVGSNSTGVTVDQDAIRRLALTPPNGAGATSRSFESLAAVAPQAQPDTYGVGINGATSPENSYRIDGLSVNSPSFGTLGTPLSVEFVKEVKVLTSSYLPEYGRAGGGVLEVTTQTGSNQFHGSVWFNITPGLFEGRREPIRQSGSVLEVRPELDSLRDFGAGVGGPILRDKLWFYAGVQAAFGRFKLTRRINQYRLDELGNPLVDPATGFTIADPIPGTDRVHYADERTLQYMGKLTYRLNEDHSLSLSVFGTPTQGGGAGLFSSVGGSPPTSTISGTYSAFGTVVVSDAHDVSLKYSGAFDQKKRLLDVTVGMHRQRIARLPSDGSALGSDEGLAGTPRVTFRRGVSGPHAITDHERVPAGYCQPVEVPIDPTDPSAGTRPVTPCPVNTWATGGPGALNDTTLVNYQARAIFTSLFTLAGHHVFKAGADLAAMTFDGRNALSGGAQYSEDRTGKFFSVTSQPGFLTGPDEPAIQSSYAVSTASIGIGGFVQDSWQILDQVTLDAGVRYDSQWIYGASGALGMALPNQISPRVGVIYDFTRQGRSRLFAHYARYTQGFYLDMAANGFPAASTLNSRVYAKTATNPDGCDPVGAPDSPACTDPDERAPGTPATSNGPRNPNRRWNQYGGNQMTVDPNLTTQSLDEIVVGGEYEVFTGARAGVTYTKRYMNQVIEDLSRDEANTYFFANPGSGIAKDFPRAERDYDALSVYFSKAFSDGWLAQASYTLSYLRGNYSGLFSPETGQLNPGGTTEFDLRSLMVNRTGALPGNRTHQIKLYAAKDFFLPGGVDMVLGLSYVSNSGAPLNYLGYHPLYGPNAVYLLPRGSAGRGDWIHSVDARAGCSFRLSGESTLLVYVDVFNLFNFQAATRRDEAYTLDETKAITLKEGEAVPSEEELEKRCLTTSGDPCVKNPSFLNPTAYQPPRQFRFGVKVTF